MKNIKKNTAKSNRLSDLAKKVDKQLMDLLKSELENLRSMNSGAPSTKIRIA